ncbi:hypothetical protein [Paraclostridium bifermentans]|uniref:hypothetical protein n=1 Tax=Paraclostridium bifermentans TaxID=1490 RepID=UPI001C7FED60|nr:hypothetical protein [Paraclostridium bifermentans]GIM33081.1 hypothetical protein PAGU1678_23510 [Paraclostridium bifermentans subsp. muricolitidis]
MINSINKNSYNVGNKSNMAISNKEQLKQQIKTPSQECESIVIRIKDELQKATLIAMKIISGESINKSEEKFIKLKYPDIKKLAEKLKEDIKQLKILIKNCNSDEERKELINREINNVNLMGKKGLISEVEVKLKLEALSDVEKFSNTVKIENKKIEVIAIKLLKNQNLTSKELALIEEKMPNIKQIINKIVKENKLLKDEVNNCNTNEEKQQKISKTFNDLESLFKNNRISDLEFKLNLFYINSLEKEIKKEKNKQLWINPYFYLNTSSLVDNLSGVLIIIVIIIAILKFI